MEKIIDLIVYLYIIPIATRLYYNLLLKVSEEVNREDVWLVKPVAITSINSCNSLIMCGKLHKEIPTHTNYVYCYIFLL